MDADDHHADVKFRKEGKSRTSNLSRELRHLDTEEDTATERKRSIGSHVTNNASNVVNNSFDSSLLNKRRGRPPRPSPSVTPKLKIKFANIVEGGKVDDRRDRIRPPKKRLSTIAMPSVEDLKRESMKFRKRVMADFTEEKRKKKEKSGKRKKRKPKAEMQIISNKTDSSTKLIIRFGKKADSDNESKQTAAAGDNNNATTEEKPEEKKPTPEKASVAPEVTDPVANDAGETSALRIVSSNKVTPIKLKLSRCHEGVGYVMTSNDQSSAGSEVRNCEASAALNLPDPVHTSTPLPLNKDCEVR